VNVWRVASCFLGGRESMDLNQLTSAELSELTVA